MSGEGLLASAPAWARRRLIESFPARSTLEAARTSGAAASPNAAAAPVSGGGGHG